MAEVKGLRQLGANMRELGDVTARKIAGQMTGAAARVVKAGAKQKVRTNPSIDTGSLEDAIIAKKVKTDLTSTHIVTARHRRSKKSKRKQSVAPHLLFVELGTVNMPAEPVLSPALTENRTKAEQAMVDAGRRGIARAVQRLKK
jgi:HK97 gp10 family phage protein